MAFKKFFRVLALFLIIYLVPSVLFSDDIKEADKLYKQLDYKYALEIYEKIMKDNPSKEVAQKIAHCYRFINNTEAAEAWYKKTLTYPEANPDNYKFLADALKQNGKFDEAGTNYKIWGEKNTAYASEATKQANICMVAKTWTENPDVGALVQNEIGLNSENSDFSPVKFGSDMLLISDRWQKDKKGEETYGWTGNPYLKIYSANSSKQVSILKGSINKGFHSGPVAIYPSLDTLIFTRAVLPNKKAKVGEVGKQYLLMAVKKDGEWIAKDKLPFNSEGQFSVQHPALSPDGKVLYFASDMPGGLGGMDLYFSEKLPNGSWTQPQNCGSQINTSQDDVFPSVRADGKFYFASKGHIGMGGLDIFSSVGEKNKFAEVENLRAPLNSPKDDFGVMFNVDNKTGYLSSNRGGGVGLDDIYSFKTGIKADPKPQEQLFVVNGLVLEKGTNLPISGLEVLLINKNTGAETKVLSDKDGKFSFNLEKETDYTVKGNPLQYFTSQSGEISTKGSSQSTIYDIKFDLERSKDVFTVKLNNIFYDFNKWNIRKDAYGDLNKVNAFMANMSNVRMELVAHTDARGTADYNQQLSEKRANSALDYLVKQGVSPDRLEAIGKGESELLNQCSDGVKCTEAQHQLNRRTEFKIVKVTPVMAMTKVQKKQLN
ncbi:OmpA family protein [Pedobacter xixiisoli]|uniref:WD40-like Beta Propeller Repeat n=1 Tax=Pedobacter xixiisoli TaxID=1476464 RepID=A0A285ZZG6_9SPHI|nr:OmpA family protein [Pedobacter xixiisoli]SOD15017.1 WD40-like Beta Propeller Repeat [Pedobacter xixiisoli]